MSDDVGQDEEFHAWQKRMEELEKEHTVESRRWRDRAEGREEERSGDFHRWQGRIEARLDAVEKDVQGIQKSFETVISRLSAIEINLASLKTRMGIIVAIAGFSGAILANWLVQR